MKRKKILLLCSSFVLLAIGLFTIHHKVFAGAHGHEDSGRDMHHAMMQLIAKAHENPELRTELLDYCNNNIYPALKNERLQFDRKLTAPEKITIAQVRMSLHARESEIIKTMQTMHHGSPYSEPDVEKAKALHKELMTIIEPLQPIIQKYNSELTAIGERLYANAGEWHKNIGNIAHKWLAKEPETEKSEKTHQHFRHLHKKHSEHKNIDMHSIIMMSFILLDPTAASIEECFPIRLHNSTNNASPMPMTTNAALSVYPNPATKQSTIDFEVLNSGKVLIEIIDKEGHVVTTLLNETREKGKYSMSINIEQYKESIYYIRYTNGKNTISTMILKQ